MGNQFGNYPSKESAESAILAEGYTRHSDGHFTKRSMTGGSLIDAPRACTSIVEITSYRVDGKYAADGKDYLVWQHHFI